MIVVTFGTFDLFHIGHLNILKRCHDIDSDPITLIVGVSSDALNYSKKNKYPVYEEAYRMAIVNHIKGVHEVFLEESLDLKRDYLKRYKADALVMGDDWKGKFDMYSDICQVIYLPRTPNVSTTEYVASIQNRTDTF
jgi:glycerol-3-phosphate cytidylyltransferase